MKNKVLLLTLILFAAIANAQDEGIIYTDFEPDLRIQAIGYNDPHDTIKVDLDQNGTVDFKMYIATEQHSPFVRYVYVTSSWDFRYCYNNIYSHPGVYEDDTIVPYPRWWTSANGSWPLLWWNTEHYMEFMMGFRKTINSENFYAWAKIYMYLNPNGPGHHPAYGDFNIVMAYCDNTAYCTIPDYPLRWGETEILGVEENNEANAFATLHPNPTSGILIVKGESLRQAEVLNMLGQQVLSVHGKGNELHINMAALPMGVYFVNITDEEGRKCVRKVVKE